VKKQKSKFRDPIRKKNVWTESFRLSAKAVFEEIRNAKKNANPIINITTVELTGHWSKIHSNSMAAPNVLIP
jgi:hypothetical protein